MENNLPEGWEIKKFTEVLDVQGGTQPPKSEFIYAPQRGYVRLLQIRDFGNRPVPTYIPFKKQLKTCKKEDILIARYGASIGRIVTGMEGAYNVALAKVIIPDSFNKKFVYYLLKSNLFQHPILSNERSAQDGFNKNDLSEIDIPFPSIKEQEFVVKKLDIVFKKIQSVQTRLVRISQILKQFRHSVLSVAVSGELTKDWRKKNKQEDWHRKKLNDVLVSIQAGKSLKCTERPPEKGEIGIVKVSAVSWGEFLENESKTITDKKYFNKTYLIKSGDFLFSRANTNELIGAVVIVKQVNRELMLSDKILRFSFTNEVLPMWVLYSLRSQDGRNQIEKFATGNQQSMMNISQGKMKEIEILIPSLKEQKEIVRRVEKLFSIADKIEERYNNIDAKTDKLPQSVLAKAFRGELVKTNSVTVADKN